MRVAVLGDRTGEPDDVLWRDMVEQVGRLRPDLVLTVGDLADDADDEADWARAMAPLDELEALGIEVQYTPGNHDIHDEASEARFWRLTGQKPYRSFDRGGIHWVVLDNSVASDGDGLSADQMAWLDADLVAHPGPKVVLMHKPFWAHAAAVGGPDPLHERFVRHDVVAVLTGHWHRHAHQRIDGIDYVIVGSSGGGRTGVPSLALGTTTEFLWLTAGESVTMATMGEGGARAVELPSLADEQVLHRLQRRGGLRVVLDAAGTELRLAGRADTTAMAVTGLVVGTDLPPLVLELSPGAEGSGDPVRLTSPASLPLPRVRTTVELPDSGPTPIDVVPDWSRVAMSHPQTPVIDGDLSEWTDQVPSVSAEQWTTGLGDVSDLDPTTLWVAHDPEALYLTARCADREPEHIKALHASRDGQAVYNDRIGVLLSPSESSLFWVYLTASGAVWDVDVSEDGAGFAWNAAESVARVASDGWTVEARIPWKALGLAGPPEALGFDARRKQEHRQVEGVFTPAFFATDPQRLGRLVLGP